MAMRSLSSATLALLAPGASLQGPTATDRLDAWREDLEHLVAEMERMHPDLYFGTPREDFEAAIDSLFSRLDGLSDVEIVIEMMKLVALISREGRDGHSILHPGADHHYAPVRIYSFADGWFVVSAREPYGELIGARVLRVADVPVDRALERLAPCLTKDNEHDLRAKLPLALTCTEVLHALGLAPEPGLLSLQLEGRGGEARHAQVAAVDLPTFLEWEAFEMLPPVVGEGLAARHPGRTLWMEPVEEARALYVRYDAVRAEDEQGRSLADFAAEMAATFESGGFDRLVIDVRRNQGGDNTTFGPLIEALVACDSLDRPGGLRALVGRHTYSAAGNFVTTLQRRTSAQLVGEATGGAPNQYGDSQPVRLPNHAGVHVEISTRYHSFARPDDERTTHEPDVPVPLTSVDYFAGRDAALAAALER